jgi:hypothetical protein
MESAYNTAVLSFIARETSITFLSMKETENEMYDV